MLICPHLPLVSLEAFVSLPMSSTNPPSGLGPVMAGPAAPPVGAVPLPMPQRRPEAAPRQTSCQTQSRQRGHARPPRRQALLRRASAAAVRPKMRRPARRQPTKSVNRWLGPSDLGCLVLF